MTKKERNRINNQDIHRYLQRLWNKFNQERFFNALPICPTFAICPDSKFLAAYSFTLKKGQVQDGKILFSKKLFYQAPQKMFADAFLHEMAHQYCVEVLNLPHEGHGKIWKLVCVAVGAKPLTKTPWIE